jgi:excisionase family DNA binding protein
METTTADSLYLTYEEAARYCNLERTTLYRATKTGRLKRSGPGMAVRFHRDDLDAWMRSRSRK